MPIRTRIPENQDEIIKELMHTNYNANKLSICSAFGGMQMSYNFLFDSYLKVIDKRKKGESEVVRWTINIGREAITLVKTFLQAGVRVRHIRSMPPMNFGVSDKEVTITIERMEGGKMSQSFLISNSVFEELWKNGIDAEDRIRDIEGGVELADVEVIPNASKAHELYFQLLKAATEEVLLLFPTVNAFTRQEEIVVGSLMLSNLKLRTTPVAAIERNNRIN